MNNPAHVLFSRALNREALGEMNATQKSYSDSHIYAAGSVHARAPRTDSNLTKREQAAPAEAALHDLADFVAHQLQHNSQRQGASTCGNEITSQSHYKSDLVGTSTPMKRLAGAIQKIAPLNSTVLILGETGTGKELVARAIHQNSPRANKPFITVNSNALTETIFDSQLMGHVRGAFTGAHRDELGAVRAAAGGTLFLDEVGDVPLQLQGKLLRVLQERIVTPLGTSKEHKVDVRFVAATNKDLVREVREGRFRDDLYWRLRVQEIVTPTLRVRLGDIPELVGYFHSKLPAEMNLNEPPPITREALHVLCRHHWPGNVRELENVMARLLAENSPGGIVTDEAAAIELGMSPAVETSTRELPRVVLPPEMSEWYFTEESLDQYAKRVKAAMLGSLQMQAGGATAAAQWLGISIKMFYQLRQRVNEAAGQVLIIGRNYINSNNLRTRKGEYG